jgi:hypothetical protein
MDLVEQNAARAAALALIEERAEALIEAWAAVDEGPYRNLGISQIQQVLDLARLGLAPLQSEA